jgi:hypothetical protein
MGFYQNDMGFEALVAFRGRQIYLDDFASEQRRGGGT